MDDDDFVQQAVRRRVGVATLRKLRQMVDDDAAQARDEARWARYLGIGFLFALLAFVIWFAVRTMR